ncbi:MAG: hypothetical protein ACC635_05790, partial [Acidiferrobacterales bacterium]
IRAYFLTGLVLGSFCAMPALSKDGQVPGSTWMCGNGFLYLSGYVGLRALGCAAILEAGVAGGNIFPISGPNRP